jgi:transcriptional regulator with XRE-family HTH domain
MGATLRQRFGDRIKTLRQAAGMSQEAFADRCGLARSYMSRVERGQGNPSLDALEVLAAALKVEVRELFPSEAVEAAAETPAPPVMVPFAADGSHFHPGLAKPRNGRYYVGSKEAIRTFASFEAALTYLRQMKVAYWMRLNASGHWSRVKAVRWDVLPDV